MESTKTLSKAIGPGLLFAGAAIGASHLVQSTRAGAVYGLSLFAVVIFANVIKYPAFSFGPRYASSTGVSLLEGYRRQGWWALLLWGLITLLTMFTIQAAVTFVTAGLAIALFQVPWNPLVLSAVIMAVCLSLLAVGQYHWLDLIVKVAVVTLTIGTVAATVMVLPQVQWGQAMWPDATFLTEPKKFFFVAALIGWMPTAIDLSIWHSLWTLAKRRDTGHKPSVRESLLDFNIGYLTTAILGLCFVLLGAGVVYDKGIDLPGPAARFAGVVIGLYTKTLGDWSRPIIGGAAFLVMFSTTLTVVDGLPRSITAFYARCKGAEREGDPVGTSHSLGYWLTAIIVAGGALLLLSQFMSRLKDLVDLATTVALVTAPPLAWLNHRVIYSGDVAHPPSAAMRKMSLVCMLIMAALSLYYLYLRFL